MIPASAAWIEQENSPNPDPVYFATFLPHYFATGLAAGSGTFVGISYVGPGRLQVDEDAGLAIWTSPVLAAVVSNYPTTITPTWSLDYPGFDCAVEYRTTTSAAALAAAAWQPFTVNEPTSLYRYYQWRITFAGIRSWAYDTQEEAEASGSSAWALDTVDPTDPYESFAVDTAFTGMVAFIENVKFTGIFEVDPDDIKDWGSCVEKCPPDLGDLVAGDYTIVMANRDQKYSSSHTNFVFAAEPRPEKKKLLIEMAYRLPNGTYTERIPRYLGTVQEWGPTPGGMADKKTGKLQEHTATIPTRDVLADIMDRIVGAPGDDGKANPMVMGEIFRQMDQVADETLGDPDAQVDFEGGDTTGLAGVDSAAGGVVAVAATDPINGSYYLHTEVANAGAFAKGRLDLAAVGIEVLFTAPVRFAAIPATPVDKNMHFMGLYDNAGNENVQLFVGSDFRVYVYALGQWKEVDWYVNRDVNVVKTVSIGVSGYTAGTLKVWLNGNEVLTWDGDWSGLSIKGGYIGPHNAAAEAWSLDSDDWKIFPNWWPQLFRVPGGPYQSIGTVYVEGAIRVGPEAVNANLNRRNLKFGSGGVPVTLVGGVTQTTGVEKYPEYGAVAFTDYSAKVSGTVAAYLTKDNITHWVDAVRALLALHGWDVYLDEDSAAAVKAATPDDSAGYYFDNMTVGDAIKALESTCLFSLFRTGTQLKLEAYTGVAPDTYDLELTEADLQSWSPVRKDREIKNKVFTKYSRYAQNNRFSCLEKDDASIADLGLYDSQVDLSWGGGCIGSDNGAMAQRKTTAQFRRLSRGRLDINDVISTLRLVRLQAGDRVLLNVPDIGPPMIMRVAENGVNKMTPKGTTLVLTKYLGEQAT